MDVLKEDEDLSLYLGVMKMNSELLYPNAKNKSFSDRGMVILAGDKNYSHPDFKPISSLKLKMIGRRVVELIKSKAKVVKEKFYKSRILREFEWDGTKIVERITRYNWFLVIKKKDFQTMKRLILNQSQD